MIVLKVLARFFVPAGGRSEGLGRSSVSAGDRSEGLGPFLSTKKILTVYFLPSWRQGSFLCFPTMKVLVDLQIVIAFNS